MHTDTALHAITGHPGSAHRHVIDTAQALLADDKGLLAMDESTHTCNQHLADAGMAATPALRRTYREMLLGTPGLGTCISGVILVDETIRQANHKGMPFVQVAKAAGLRVGIKVDTGAHGLAGHPGEQVTEGLDGLRERLQTYVELGACFAKWRAVFTVDAEHLPSRACIDANAHALARYAALCQEAGLVPVVEPEVMMAGANTLARGQAVTEAVLRSVFAQLVAQGVVLEAVILKPNMVVAGLQCPVQNTAAEVAAATLQCLRRVVPAAVPGVMFLSGGQSGAEATGRLQALHAQQAMPDANALPWPLSFSFARALQHPALDIWAGQADRVPAAQAALLHRAQCNRAAVQGRYSAAMETDGQAFRRLAPAG